MTSLPEQFSAARTWQINAQFDLFRALTTQVIESTQQVIALNLDTSRAAAERSAKAVRQLFAMKDPRDLLAFGGQGEEQFQQMLAYTRELFSIAAGAQNRLREAGASVTLPPSRAPEPLPQDWLPQDRLPASVPGDASAASEAAAGGKRVKPSKKPVVATAPEAAPEPAATANPIAKAVGKVAPAPATARHPMASPLATQGGDVPLQQVKPVDAAPPPAPAAGTPEIGARQAQLATFRNGRKK